LIASRNGKGELAFRGSFPSDAFSFMDCHFGHETDMHPVDLIRDSSMLVRQKFKFNGVPDIPLVKSKEAKISPKGIGIIP
jgi:hypothetical protein